MKTKYLIIFTLIAFVYNASGQTYFNKIYRYSSPDSSTRQENFTPILELPGGGYIAAGYTNNYVTKQSRVMVSILDTLGNVTITNLYGDSGYYYYVRSMQYTYDNNVILHGEKSRYTNQNDSMFFYLQKLNLNGNLIWAKQYTSGLIKSEGIKAIETSDHGFALIGITGTSFNPGCKMYLIKTDSLGNKEWGMQYGDSSNYIYYGLSVLQESDGGYVVQGITGTNGSFYRMITVIRTDSVGNKLWQRDYGLPTMAAHAESIIKIKDGNYLISGQNGIPFGDLSGLLIKTDTLGNVLWQKNYGFTKASIIRGMVENSDGTINFNLSISNNSPLVEKACLYRVDMNGDSLWSQCYVFDTSVINNNCYSYYMTSTSDKGYIISGQQRQAFPATQDAWLVKVDSLGCEVAGCIPVNTPNQQSTNTGISNFPNPFNQSTTIQINELRDYDGCTLLIHNILGQPLKQFSIQAPNTTFKISASDFPPGVYYYTLFNRHKTRLQTKLMTVIK